LHLSLKEEAGILPKQEGGPTNIFESIELGPLAAVLRRHTPVNF